MPGEGSDTRHARRIHPSLSDRDLLAREERRLAHRLRTRVVRPVGVLDRLSDRREFQANVVGTDPRTDIALLQIDGGLEDGAMVLRAELSGPDGSVQQHRVTWTPNDDGSVRQHWEASADGEQWNTLFDGMYRKKSDSD